jgi:hypothetical protein
MAYNLTKSLAPTDKVGYTFPTTEEFSGGTRVPIDLEVAASLTNHQCPLSFARSGAQLIYIVADGDCTLKTNSSGSPDDTINLLEGVPWEWDGTSGYFAQPLHADVSTVYVTTTTDAVRITGVVIYP